MLFVLNKKLMHEQIKMLCDHEQTSYHGFIIAFIVNKGTCIKMKYRGGQIPNKAYNKMKDEDVRLRFVIDMQSLKNGTVDIDKTIFLCYR